MNFLKNLWKGTPKDALDENMKIIYEFSLLCSCFKIENQTQEPLSQNTECVFDGLTNDKFDSILILRFKKVLHEYDNTMYQKKGDLYFNMSFIKKITAFEFDLNFERISLEITDTKKKEWHIELQIGKYNLETVSKLEKFKEYLQKLLWVQDKQKPLSQLGKQAYQYIQLIQKTQSEQIKKTAKQGAKAKLNKTILQELIKRTKNEKEQLAERLTYFCTIKTIKQVFSGVLFQFDGVAINKIGDIFLAISQYKKDSFIELYKNKELNFVQPILEFSHILVEADDNYISWYISGGMDDSNVYFVKFDQPDGAVVAYVYIQKAKQRFRRVEIKDKEEQQWVDQCMNQQTTKQQEKIIFEDEGKVIHNLQQGKKIFLTPDIILNNKNLISKQITQLDINPYNRAVLSKNQKILLTYQQFESKYTETRENQSKIVKTDFAIVDIAMTMESESFVFLSYKTLHFNNKIVYQMHDQSNDQLSCIKCNSTNSVAVGTSNGSLLLFDDVQSMKLVNVFPGFGDPISEIKIHNSTLFLNFGSYLHLQNVQSTIDGFKETFIIRPVPEKLYLSPEDLLILGVDGPFTSIAIGDKVCAASIENALIIWSNSYREVIYIQYLDKTM